MVIVTFTCWSARREKKKIATMQREAKATPRKKRFGLF